MVAGLLSFVFAAIWYFGVAVSQDTTAARFVAALVLVATSGCATIFKGTGQDVTFTSNPKGAEIYVRGQFIGRTPITARVGHGLNKVVEARMPGRAPKQDVLTTSFSGLSLLLFPLSFGYDAITGSIFTLDENSLHFELDPLTEPPLATDRLQQRSESVERAPKPTARAPGFEDLMAPSTPTIPASNASPQRPENREPAKATTGQTGAPALTSPSVR